MPVTDIIIGDSLLFCGGATSGICFCCCCCWCGCWSIFFADESFFLRLFCDLKLDEFRMEQLEFELNEDRDEIEIESCFCILLLPSDSLLLLLLLLFEFESSDLVKYCMNLFILLSLCGSCDFSRSSVDVSLLFVS